jgi:hypothetical protein
MDEDQMKAAAPGVAKWWGEANDLWENNKRKASRLSLLENLDFQSKLTKQLGAVKHRVVYSASGNAIAAARLDNPAQIIEHALYWLPARSKQEAQYLTAVLNAPATTRAVSLYQSRGLHGARHFDTYVWRLPIPIFDASHELHCRLVELAQHAEDAASQVDIEGFGFQKARRLIREHLQHEGITPEIEKAVATLLNIEPEDLLGD